MKSKRDHSGIWIMIVAAVVLEATACIQYFASREAVRKEAVERAQSELRKAELEIEKHTVEMEAAAQVLAMLAEKHAENPDSVFAATRSVVGAIRNTSSVAVAYVPGYFKGKRLKATGERIGDYFEACSSRITEDSIYTRQIGSAAHDYTQMEWYQRGFMHDSCWWCEPYLDDSGSKTWVVSCSYPVHDRAGKVVAVVCVDLSLDYLESLSEYLQIFEDSYYSIHSADGTKIVAAPDTVAGRKYYTFTEESPATGWRMEIIIPDDVLFKDLRRMGLLILILMFVGLAVLAFMLVHSARTTKRLIESLEKNQRMESELQIASTIQTAMLPKVFPPFLDRPDLDLYGVVHPAKEIGGDLYDFYVRHEKLFFCVGDVSGKGVPAALVMATTRSLFRSITSHEEEPDVIMRKMNRAFVDQNTQNMFLTLFLGVLDCKTGKLGYCNAGHNAPMILKNGQWETADVVANLPLGIEPDFEFKAQQTQLHYNDVLFLYTDGLTEAENGVHEQFGEQRMKDGLDDRKLRTDGFNPLHIVHSMQAKVTAFVDGAEQSDDLTMMAIRYQIPALMMSNDIGQIPTLPEWIDALDVPADVNMQINLALEEAVSNVMLYAYPGSSGKLLVECVKVEGQLIFSITDSGVPFDPTQREEADTTLSAEEREIGGLGIHLVKQIMDDVRYARIEETNVLTLIKKI